MRKITKLYQSSFNKARCASFHQEVLKLIEENGLDQEEDIKGIVARYKALNTELQDLVDYSKAYETTPAIHEALDIVSTRYRYMRNVFRSLEQNRSIVSEEEYQKLKNEVIDPFPLTIFRQNWSEKMGTLSVLVAHLRNDWMPLLEKSNLTQDFSDLEQQVSVLNNALLNRSEEKSDIEKGRVLRFMNEILGTYSLLVLYIEAWSNTEHENPALQLRQQKASNVLLRTNEIIAGFKHSLAVARSNRRRAKNASLRGDEV